MFGGIVECIGTITNLVTDQGCKHFTIAPKVVFDDISIGDSIAVNGVCLTVTSFDMQSFSVTAVPETLRLTNLDNLSLHSNVNLERSLKMGARIGGHCVQGHVEGTGKILEIKNEANHTSIVKFSTPKTLSKYMVNKGYITIDGMSITIIESAPEWFTVTFIPHTQEITIVNQYQVGTLVNLETDILVRSLAHANSN